MDPFKSFMRGLMADERLGRTIPRTLATQPPEVIILTLAQALASARERTELHPAYALLEELDGAR